MTREEAIDEAVRRVYNKYPRYLRILAGDPRHHYLELNIMLDIMTLILFEYRKIMTNPDKIVRWSGNYRFAGHE